MTTLTRFPKLLALAVALVGGAALPQTNLLVPAAAAAQDLNAYVSAPFKTNWRTLFILDSSHFTDAGISYPILLSRLRFRADATANPWTAATIGNLTVALSTATRDYTLISTTPSVNHGPDVTVVWSGSRTTIAGSSSPGVPGPYFLEINFTTGFVYTPSSGDLVLDIQYDPTIATPFLDASSVVGQARARKIANNTLGGGFTASPGEVCPAVEFSYLPQGLFPDFSASPTSGNQSPMTVQFTDLTFSSAPGGVTSWAWDLNNDGVVDSRLQHPSNAFGGCTSYDVRLTVTDAWHGSQTVLKRGYVTVSDQVTAKFEWGAGPTPMSLAFTEMSCFGNPTGCPSGGNVAGPWEWDFDGDGITDSTARNPIWTFPPGCTRVPVRLKAWHQNCFDVVTKYVLPGRRIVSSAGSSPSRPTNTTVFLDLEVRNPAGVFLCGIEAMAPQIYPFCQPPFSQCFNFLHVDVYATDGGWHGRDEQPSAWWLLGVCTGGRGGAGPGIPLFVLGEFPAGASPYLPAGRYGLAMTFPGDSFAELGGVPATVDDGNLRIAIGGDRDGLFSGTFSARGWSGTLRYRLAGSEANNAGVALRGPGCAGALGVPQLTVSPAAGPQIGQLYQFTCTHLPLNVGAMVIGFSGTLSPLGPLPFLLPFTSTCFIRNSLDIPQPMPGVGNVGTWSLTLPNDPSLLGAALFHQVVVPDSSANQLGLVLSDAYGSVIGL